MEGASVWDRKSFLKLGDVVPPALGEDIPGSTVTVRLRAAHSVARQLRCGYQLSVDEREELLGTRTLGDRVLGAEREDVLQLLLKLDEYPKLKKKLDENKGWRELPDLPGLRSAYGYRADGWARDTREADVKLKPLRVVARVGVCLVADATFAPYARGLLDAIADRQASLRIDLRSVAYLIWLWADDHPALARSLAIARTALDGETSMGFPAFTRLLRRVLSDHLESGLEDETLADEIYAAAESLSQLATHTLEGIGTPRGAYSATIYRPMTVLLAETHPDWLPEEQTVDPRREFARGAAPRVLAGLLGRERPEEIADDLDALAQALRSVAERGDSDAWAQ